MLHNFMTLKTLKQTGAIFGVISLTYIKNYGTIVPNNDPVLVIISRRCLFSMKKTPSYMGKYMSAKSNVI